MTDNMHTSVIERETNLKDDHGRWIAYRVQLQQTPSGAYRVWAHQLRDGRPRGRGTTPLLVKNLESARALADRLFDDHLRYVQRNVARRHLQALEAED